MLQVSENTKYYKGKVRDVYTLGEFIFIVVSDRISAFDVVFPETIPFKGAVLNGISTHLLYETNDLVPNWLIDSPNPYFSYGHYAPTIPIEMVVRGYITGSMWRAYEAGDRVFCGIELPEGLKKNQKLISPIITPTTKALEGHDENTSETEIIAQGIVTESVWKVMKSYALLLFDFGQNYAQSRNLILVDTKFEFGKKKNGEIILIDEILTPDSSRYFEASNYKEKFDLGESPDQLSKEFVREWLISKGFMGRIEDKIPELRLDWVNEISEKYIDLYNKLIDPPFVKEAKEFDLDKIQEEYDKINEQLFG